MSFAKWLLWSQTLFKFYLTNSGIAVQVDPSNNCHEIIIVGYKAMFPQVTFKICLIYKSIVPVVNVLVGLVDVKLFIRMQFLLHLF